MNKLKYILLLPLVILVSSCTGVALKHATPDTALLDGEVMIVGKFILDPPLEDMEQTVDLGGVDLFNVEERYEKMIKNKIIYLTSTEKKELDDDNYPSLSEYNNRIEAVLNLNYYVVSKNKPLYLLQGMIMTGAQSRIRLPGNMVVKIKPNDKAVYVGTIKITRDDYNSITNFEVINNYKSSKKEFVKHFGKKIKLRQSLVKVVK